MIHDSIPSPGRRATGAIDVFRHNRKALLFSSALTLVSGIPAAWAEEAGELKSSESDIPDITITATKRATSLDKTPLAVSAIGSESLSTERIQILKDVNGTVPGLLAPNSNWNMQSNYIRGIGTSDPGMYPAVAVYDDDVYVPKAFGNALFDLPDVERVEILRGPQGTLYGMSSSGGAIRYVVREPQETFQGFVDSGYGELNTIQNHAYVTGALVPGKLAASLAYAHRQADGFTRNTLLNRDIDAVFTDQGRGRLLWKGDDGQKALLSIGLFRDSSDNNTYVARSSDPRTVATPIDTELLRYGGSGSLKYDAPVGDTQSFRSITAVRGFIDDNSPWESDGTPQYLSGWTQYMDQWQFSQELQLNGKINSIDYTLGATFFNENYAFERWNYSRNAAGVVNWTDQFSSIKDVNYGVFGEATYPLTSSLSVTGGLRLNTDTQDYANSLYASNASHQLGALTYSTGSLNKRWTSALPKLSLNYQATPDILAYALYSTGNKAGGYNRAATTMSSATYATDPESVKTYEGGLKVRALGGRLQNRLAVFYNVYSDIQTSIANAVIGGVATNSSAVINAGRAHSYGAELESTVKATEDLELRFSGALLKSNVDYFNNPTNVAITSNPVGNQLPYAPPVTLGVGTFYTLPWKDQGTTKFFAKYRFTAPYFLDIQNSSWLKIKEQQYVDLGASYTPPNAPLTFSINVSNLLDSTNRINNSFNAASGINASQYNPPRTVYASVRYDF